jgi:hypothetical protein
VLEQALEILGVPEIVVHIAASAPVATLVARLTDVAPDGTSAQVTAGILNLTHRRSHEDPVPLVPGTVEEVRLELRPAGYRFVPGHRIRVSLASSAWPVVWPSPYAAELEIHHGPDKPSRVVLPVIVPAGGEGDVPVPDFKTTPPDLPPVGGEGDADPPVWRIEEDVIDGSVAVHIHDGGEDVLGDGRRLYSAESITLTAWDADPARARLDAYVVYRWREIGADVDIRARSTQTSDVESFQLSVDLDVELDGAPFFRRSWTESIPRRLV